MSNLSAISVAILAGGMGTRLRPIVSTRQKVLAKIGGQPFLQNILEKLNSSGFKNIVICTGYLGKQIKKEFGKKFKNLNLSYSREKLPLGTAGALRKALPLLRSKDILVMNGDSFCDVDLKKFQKFHTEKGAQANLVLSHMSNTNRYGKVRLDRKDRIISFEEKRERRGSGWISAGIYLLDRSLILKIPKNITISLEKEIFPNWMGQRFYAYKSKGHFIDIGTPESFALAKEFFTRSKMEQRRFVLLDRDGTIIVKRNYLSNPDHLELIPGVGKALRKFKKMGLGLLVITNQSGIGRGYFDLATLDKIHDKLNELLAKEGIVLDGIYFCPHTPEDNCLCRKPQIALVEQARKKHNFDPKLAFMIGDNMGDIELGNNIGATTILVKTGYGVETARNKDVNSAHVVSDLHSAVRIIRQELLK